MRETIFLVIAIAIANYGFAQTFTKITPASIPALSNSKVQWADFNNDGLLDLFLTGTQEGGGFITGVYISNGSNTFNTINLTPLTDVAFDLGDYDNDGFIDILLSGTNSSNARKALIYRNNSGASFSQQAFSIDQISRGGVLWEDLDHDTDLDILITGLDESNNEKTVLYKYESGDYLSATPNLPNVSNGELKSFDANNDGKPEILITGIDADGNLLLRIYTVSTNLTFSIYSDDLDGSGFNSISTADYNEDGFEDLLAAGISGGTQETKTTLLENNGVNGFTSVSAGLQNTKSASVDFGDINNDGLADIILTGIDDGSLKYFKYYQNSASYSFSLATHSIENIYNGDVSLGDYDNDGDLDIFQTGDSDIEFQGNIYSSNQSATQANAAPSSPANLSATATVDSVYLTWDEATDDLTDANSISYNVYLSTDPNGANLLVSPNSDISTGFRKIPAGGNAGYRNFMSFQNLPEGRYYWSVQAIDNGYKGSAFATEETFAVCYPVSLGSDTTICFNDNIDLETGDPSDVVNWYSKSDGLLLSNSNTFSHLITENDTVIVEVTRPFNCTVRDTLIVKVSLPPVIDLGANTSICFGEEFSSEISNAVDSVNWYRPGELLAQDVHEYSYAVTVKDTLIAEAFNIFKCVSRDTTIVDVLALPQFELGSDTSICYKEELLLELDDFWPLVNWYMPGNQVLALDTNRYLLTVLEDVSVIAEVTDGNGCINRDTINVASLPLPQFDVGEDTAICYQEDMLLELADNLGIIDWYQSAGPLLASDTSRYLHHVLLSSEIVAKVTDSNGCISYDSLMVDVISLPQFDIGADMAICFNKNILLETGAGFATVNWHSKKTGLLLVQNNWFYDYKVTDTDTLIAEVFSAAGCVNFDTIAVRNITLPDFSLGDDRNICINDSLKLEIPGTWDEVNWYTEEDILLEADNPEFTFRVEESISLWAEVFNEEGCVNTDTLKVNALPLPVFDLGADVAFCKRDELSFDPDVTASSFAWVNQDKVLLAETKKYTFTANGTTTLYLTSTSADQCIYVDSIKVTVHELPSFEIEGDKEICAGDSTRLNVNYANLKTISWYQNQQASPIESEASLIYLIDETSSISALLTDNNGCSSTETAEVVIRPRPIAYAGEDVLICYSESVAIGQEYEDDQLQIKWSPAQFLSDPEAGNPLASPVLSTTYKVALTNSFECVSVDSVHIEVNPRIVVDAGMDAAICIGDSMALGGNPTASGSKFSYSYQWIDDGNVALPDNTPSPVVSPDRSTRYYVLVSSGKCAIEYDSIYITVNPLPQITIISDQSIGAGSSVKLSSSGGVAYSWSPEETLDDSHSDSPVASPLRTTTYTVSVMDANNCTGQAQVDVLVQNTLFIPNLFTPNHDGSNDVFKLFGSGVERIVFSVFDQNGTKVFSTENVKEAFETGWDGTYKGTSLKNDVYIWTIDGNYYNGEKVQYKGSTQGIIKLVR